MPVGKLSGYYSCFDAHCLTSDDISKFPHGLHAVVYEGCCYHVVFGSSEDKIIDVFAPEHIEGNMSAIIAIKLYLEHLRLQGLTKASIIFAVPKTQLIRLALELLSVYAIAVQNGNLALDIYTSLEVYKADFISDDMKHQLIVQSREISSNLRKAHFQSSNKLHGIRREPLVGHPRSGVVAGSLGAFPEFILPTFPCEKTMQGFCSPCFFSKVHMSDSTRDMIYKSFEIQTRFIVDNFDEQVIKCQLRLDPETKTLWDVTLCFASNGSLFSNLETTPDGRFNSFKMLCDEISRRNLSSLVYIETCADDYVRFLDSDEAKELVPILQKINTVILCGFESAQDFTRDVLYAKALELSDFEEVLLRNRELGLQTGAFLYTGFHSMTQIEIIADLLKSLCYLLVRDVIPVLMIPKLHDFTLPDMLYRYDYYNIIDPYTILTITEITAWMTSVFSVPLKKDRWLMSDLFDDIPPSNTSFFTNGKNILCPSCTTVIRDTLQNIRASMDYDMFAIAKSSVMSCENGCFERYMYQLVHEDAVRKEKSLLERTIINTEYAMKKKKQYINALCDYRANEKAQISITRKELLCYGINVDKDTITRLCSLNPSFGTAKFIHNAQVQLPDGSYVNAPIAEEYCKLSEYSLSVNNCGINLLKNGKPLFAVSIPPIPQWTDYRLSDGIKVSDVIGVHGHNTLSLVKYTECYYKKIGRTCTFCGCNENFNGKDSILFSPSYIAEAVKLALSGGQEYSLALSGGMAESSDRGALLFCEIAKAVLAQSPNVGISVEIAPPVSNKYIDMLVDAGIKSIIMNLEIFDDAIRAKYCPGKIEIPSSRYFEALSYAVSKLSSWSVSSVLIAGLENIESTVTGAKKLIDIGVIPTIMPFRPYDNCEMSDHPMTNPEILMEIERELHQYPRKTNLDNCKHAEGCLSCNGCSGVDLGFSASSKT